MGRWEPGTTTRACYRTGHGGLEAASPFNRSGQYCRTLGNECNNTDYMRRVVSRTTLYAMVFTFVNE